jgi:ribosomal protein L3
MVQKTIDYLVVLEQEVPLVAYIREKKMAGHLGNTTVTLTKTEILYVNPEENILVVKGSVPGKKNSVLKIQHKKVR